jgi:hypothetical protein
VNIGVKTERTNRRSGLTLVEVVLATAIMGLSFGFLLTALSRCLVVFKVSRDLHTAQYVADQARAEFPMLVNAIKPGDDPMDWEVDGETYLDRFTYSRTIEDPDADSDEDVRLLLVSERIAWEGRTGRERAEEVTRYVLYRENK